MASEKAGDRIADSTESISGNCGSSTSPMEAQRQMQVLGFDPPDPGKPGTQAGDPVAHALGQIHRDEQPNHALVLGNETSGEGDLSRCMRRDVYHDPMGRDILFGFDDTDDIGENPLHDAFDPLGGRMIAVRLVERRNRRDTVEEERLQRHVIGRRQLRIDGVECLGIPVAEIRRRQHAGE